MPSSRRTKKVSLTQTSKKDRTHKSSVISSVRSALDAHTSLYVFTYSSLRSSHFQSVRKDWSDSRLFISKNKLTQLALGKGEEDEYKENLRFASKMLKGSCGLLLTSRGKDEVVRYFSSLASADYIRAGATSPRTVNMTNRDLTVHPVSMLPQLKKLGVPCAVTNGKVTLLTGSEWQVVKEGRVVTAEQAKVLGLMGEKLAEFRVELKGRWEGGEFEEL